MEKLIVFDLDFTLWNAGGTWCDHTNPPYRKIDQHVEDSYGRQIVLYPDVRDILEELALRNIKMALASRTGEPTWARQLIKLFDIGHYFKFEEIYPGSKITHFNELHQKSGILFKDMVFFDDEMRNISDVKSLGVNAIYVKNGVSWELMHHVL